jgi:phosphoribosylformylglycinamidine cyclo-ligase
MGGKPITYKDAGVDIDAGDLATRRIKEIVRKTYTPQVLSEIGLFGGLFDVSSLPESRPVLVSSVDSVGTKTKTAVACGRYDTIGHDIVNHCTNDILVQGARPLFFLDYIALGHLDPDNIAEIVGGVSSACLANECALIGGEMCEMPDVYSDGDIDLVGSIVGVVDRPRLLDGSRVSKGDVLIGLASSGLHTNGFTLARKALYGDCPEKLREVPSGFERSLGEELLEPHRSYFKTLWPLLEEERIHAMAHITGGGIPGNLARVLPEGLRVEIHTKSWPRPPIFQLLAEKTQAPEEELYRTFNMGVGMVLCVASGETDSIRETLSESGADNWRIGEVLSGEKGRPPVELLE